MSEVSIDTLHNPSTCDAACADKEGQVSFSSVATRAMLHVAEGVETEE